MKTVSNIKRTLNAEMEYCASATSLLAEEIWHIAEGFVEVPINLQAQIKNVEEISQMINNVDSKGYKGKKIVEKMLGRQ